jgi:hypothetical protein
MTLHESGSDGSNAKRRSGRTERRPDDAEDVTLDRQRVTLGVRAALSKQEGAFSKPEGALTKPEGAVSIQTSLHRVRKRRLRFTSTLFRGSCVIPETK